MASKLTFGDKDEAVDSDELNAFLGRLDRMWRENPENLGNELAEFRERLRATHGEGFRGMERVHAGAVEALNWGAAAIGEMVDDLYADESENDDETEAVEDYLWIMRGFAARAVTVFAEVSWLLEGGFPDGALARVRTLHELAVIASIIALHGQPDGDHPELVARFARHHEAFNVQAAEQLSATGVLMDDPFDPEVMTVLQEQRAELLALFGPAFAQPYGWAQPLFESRERITFKKLEALVEPGLAYLYRMSSSHVHADSEGWQHSLHERAGESVFGAGPTNRGLAVPATLAAFLLSAVIDYAVPSTIASQDGVLDVDGAKLLAGVAHLRDQALAAMGAGDDEVDRAEEAYQATRRHQTS